MMNSKGYVLLATVTLAATACAEADLEGPALESQQGALTSYPEIDFAPRPPYLPPNTIVLTFDDGADEVNTPKALDVLAAKNVKASFFINSINFGNLNTDPAVQAVVKRIVAEGHELGNHTVHHTDLTTLPAAEIEQEMNGVEEALRLPEVLGATAPRLTLLRTPFGRPYQRGDVVGYQLVAPLVAKRAVHVGWNISVRDTSVCSDRACVETTFKEAVKTPGQGAYGVVLLHSVKPYTVEALPAIIDYCRANGFEFKFVEDVVRAKYGKSSAELVDQMVTFDGGWPPGAGDGGADGGGSDGGMPDTSEAGAGDGGSPTDGGPSDGDSASDADGADANKPDAGECTPQCQDRTCGDDGCGGTCGACAGDQSCTNAGRCADSGGGCSFGS